jgi:TPP-dependent pyruvate/acetoin dehydrogenase alpha subunit
VSELGIFGNTSMLGANLPSRRASRLTYKMDQRDNVVVAYFGEGASNTGDFPRSAEHRRRSAAADLFICENNQYAYSVPLEKSMAIDDVADRAEGYGFDGVAINGNDVLAVYQATQGRWRARARRWADAHRVQDLPVARALRTRQGLLSHERRARDVEEPRSDPDLHDLPAPAFKR